MFLIIYTLFPQQLLYLKLFGHNHHLNFWSFYIFLRSVYILGLTVPFIKEEYIDNSIMYTFGSINIYHSSNRLAVVSGKKFQLDIQIVGDWGMLSPSAIMPV